MMLCSSVLKEHTLKKTVILTGVADLKKKGHPAATSGKFR